MKAEDVADYLSADAMNPEYAAAINALIAERDVLRANLERVAVWLEDDRWGTVWHETPEFFGEHYEIKGQVRATLDRKP